MTTSTARHSPAQAPQPPEKPSPLRALLALARNTWRGLTGMRTALMLLFLLALAALPGALLPQRMLNEQRVSQYLTAHPTIGPLLDKTGFFDVFSSPWFAAIYLLLTVSLIGCIAPRTTEYARACRARPVRTPSNLERLPHHASGTLDAPPDEVLTSVTGKLRGWRTEVSSDDAGTTTVSAEKGYLREAGNLVFHVALLGLLVAVAVGKLYGYSGQVIVLADGSQFCNTGILNYDSFTAGDLVDGTDLTPFCVKVNDFAARYQPNGQVEHYLGHVGYQDADQVTSGDTTHWKPYSLEVNSPLRLDGDRVYLLGNGYAPRFTVTFPDGTTRTQTTQWKPADELTMLSEGATKFDRPGADERTERTSQLAISGLLAPTSSEGKVITSLYPALLNPEVAVIVYRGDLGLNDGRGQSIFEVDQDQITSGALKKVAMRNLFPGESVKLDDGTSVRFDDVTQWVNLQVSHDPAQLAVLVFAVVMLLGLGTSLTVKRRRFWARITPAQASGRTVMELGGLAKTDQAGYGEEFDRLRDELLPSHLNKEGDT
ncbi:MAG TPA: cytochrome c biogenesis protein ResB [Pseudonocardia sp.]|jgi:cytochrome c biogenesis protein|nr:cytochrome c biogenesis protein ResB [Pseudonocardia sp.]